MFCRVLWLARTTWLKSGCTCVGSVSPSSMDGAAHGLRAVNIEVSLAEHARGFQRGDGIAMQAVVIFRTDLHRDFDGSKRLASDDRDAGDVADIDAAQPHRRARAQSFSDHRNTI